MVVMRQLEVLTEMLVSSCMCVFLFLDVRYHHPCVLRTDLYIYLSVCMQTTAVRL